MSWAAVAETEDLPITAGLVDLAGENRLLRQLVDEALANNPNLKATAHRLKAAEYFMAASRSNIFPQIDAEFTRERGNQGVDPETGMQRTANANRLSLGVRWELDIWGRLADDHAASRQAVIAQEYEYLNIRDALAARVIQAWIEQVGVRRSIAIENERITVLQRIETMLVERYQNGIGNLDELSAAKTRTEIARADLSARSAALLRSIRKVEVLLGRYPKGYLASGIHLPEMQPPRVHIPTAVLLHRPDVHAALARVESATNASRASAKARLPGLHLSGQVFRQATEL